MRSHVFVVVFVLLFFLHICVCLSPPPDVLTTPPPSTTPPLHPTPADPSALLGTHASDPTVADNRGTVPPHTTLSACYRKLPFLASRPITSHLTDSQTH